MSTVPISTVDPSAAAVLVPTPAAGAADVPVRTEAATALLPAIDASVRGPVLLFFASAIGWLLLASGLEVLASVKLNFPSVLTNFSWLTFGRVHPAATSAFVYGWAATAGIGASLWLMARLCRTPLRGSGVLTAAWGGWNLGVTLGVFGILYGHGTSFNGLEFPRYAALLIFTAFVFIALWMGLAFRQRTGSVIYISQWYLLAAFLFFPWMYATANLLLFFLPIQAPAQAVVAAWYAHGMISLWLIPMALAIAYYVVPKVVGRPLAHYSLAKFGFWTWLLSSGWSGAYDLIGGPAPAWLLSLAVVSSALTLLPLYAIGANFRGTLHGHVRGLRHSPSLRFVTVGVWCFLAAGIASAVTGFRSINAVVHFTLVGGALHELVVYGFVSLAFFGAVYYILARLLNTEWESPGLIRLHFWFSVTGFGLAALALTLGGVIQGLGLNDPKVPILALLSIVNPFLFVQLVAALILTAAHAFFAASFALILARVGEPATRRPLAMISRSLAASAAAPVSAP